MSYNRSLRAEELERSSRLSQMTSNATIPGEIDNRGNRNLIIHCGSSLTFFLRPYSSMTDEELLQEVCAFRSQDALETMMEREARETLYRHFDFPLSMACNSYAFGIGSLAVQGITTDEH